MIRPENDGGAPGKAAMGPLDMTAAQRHAFLAKRGMEMGWLLLTRAEMNAMRQAMEECQRENDRLNKQAAQMIVERMATMTSVERLQKMAEAAVHAAELLEVEAKCIKESHTTADGDWGDESTAKSSHDDMLETAATIRKHAKPESP